MSLLLIGQHYNSAWQKTSLIHFACIGVAPHLDCGVTNGGEQLQSRQMDQTWSASYGGEIVLHNISIYRIVIECEPKMDYEKCLNQHWITSKIDIEWQNCQKSVWFLKYWITFWWNLCENCSFCQFWGVFGGILRMFARNQLYQKSNLKEQISNWT